MRRWNGLLLLLLIATPAFARIISYAPYSDRITRSGYHERSGRWFLLVEGNEVVLHDSSGVDEPRVVFGPGFIEYAALYERKSARDAPPMLLVNGSLSVDGGVTWRNFPDLRSFHRMPIRDFDTGGPFVGGLGARLVPGTDEMPFILDLDEIYGVRPSGELVVLHPLADIIGRNAAGDRLLIRAAGQIMTMDLSGNTTVVMRTREGQYTGWLTADGSAYIMAGRRDGRYLSFFRPGRLEFVAGPPGATPQFDAEQLSNRLPEMSSFAVPTHDFNGAWIIQRKEGAPTTLSRHTPAGGLETMWSDPSGPEVEALIAGASGETLLVQVHRDRPMPKGPFENYTPVDPALAVWHVGQPMPSHYDELYLSEEWNKGFIHADVDRMESGAPFVFNSGVFDPDDDIIVSAGGGGDIIQEWGAVRASLRQRLVVPGVARTSGAYGSQWFTDVTIYNPFDATQEVELRFTPMGEAEASDLPGRSITLTLAPQEIRVLEDALSLFGVENGGGTLYFLPAREVNVTSRTYSRNAIGTFGFGMYAIDFFNAAGPRFPLRFTGAFPGQHFRTNVLLTDTSGRGVEAELFAHHGSSVIVADSTIAAPASGTMQFNGVSLAPAGPAPSALQGGALVVQTKRGTAIPMVVAIDNRTNDPMYLPPALATAAPRLIPAIGHLDGANGSRFRSDLYLFNTSPGTSLVTLEAAPWDGSAVRRVSFTLVGNETKTIPDALMTLFGMTGLARINVSEGNVSVTSRTYSVDASGATYGCLIPPLNGFQSALEGEQLEIVTPVGEGFRMNVALVQLDARAMDPTSVRLEIYDENGVLIRGSDESIPAGRAIQHNDVFGSDAMAPRAARIVVDVLSGSAIAAYATVTDNRTNDTMYLAGQLGAKPN